MTGSQRHARVITCLLGAVGLLGGYLGQATESHAAERAAVQLQSAGPLAFGPQATLFIGDTLAAAVVAVETGDNGPRSSGDINVEQLGKKVAALLGTSSDAIRLVDMAVNPKSGAVCLSVARGRGPDAAAVILRVGPDGDIEEFSLDDRPTTVAKLENAPDPDAKGRRGVSLRASSITDLAFHGGRVIVAGLSNEEFSSQLRAIPYPFGDDAVASSVEIYHGSHGRLETNSPVRTFLPIVIDQQPHIVAAYTCTPLVKFPLSEMAPGAKVRGTTVAELGNRNRPLDMIVYGDAGAQYILMANSSRGVMKISTRGIEDIEGIDDRVADTAGLGYETIESLEGVTQLDRLDDDHAVVITEDSDSGRIDLTTIVLP